MFKGGDKVICRNAADHPDKVNVGQIYTVSDRIPQAGLGACVRSNFFLQEIEDWYGPRGWYFNVSFFELVDPKDVPAEPPEPPKSTEKATDAFDRAMGVMR